MTEDLRQVAFFKLEEIITPVNADVLEYYLAISNYDKEGTRFLIDSFQHGFAICYEGSENRQDRLQNIPIQMGVGSKEEMWEKLMKEIKNK